MIPNVDLKISQLVTLSKVTVTLCNLLLIFLLF